MNKIKAISLDLDDTLWPIWPSIERAEQNLHNFLVAHAPKTAVQFPIPAMRHLREQVAQANPDLAHDFTAQRKLSLRHAFQLSGESESLIEPAFEAFFSARNQVTLYADCIPALNSLAKQYPLIALTNGNADLHRTGIADYFIGCIAAKDIGSTKPKRAIFEAASAKLGVEAQHILHVGDDPWLDIQGAHDAGFQSAWINRTDAIWPDEILAPHYQFNTLLDLVNTLNGEYT